MQDRYLNNKQSIDDGLKSAVEESSDKLLKRIEAIQKNLVIQGKIDEATEVRDIATKVKAAIEDGSITESFTLGEESPKESDEASEDVESVQEETHDRPQPEVTPVRPTERKTRSGLSPWRKWKYVGEKPFSPNLEKIFSVDIHSQMSLRVLDKSGISTFAVDGGAEPQQVGNQFCTWFGRAMIWTADPGDDLSVDLKVTSRKITLSRDSGPHLFVYIYHAGSIVSQIRVPIIHHELELRIVRDTTKKGHYALFWPKGGVSRQFDIVGDEKVTLIFGIAVSGTREQCDTTINFK